MNAEAPRPLRIAYLLESAELTADTTLRPHGIGSRGAVVFRTNDALSGGMSPIPAVLYDSAKVAQRLEKSFSEAIG